MFQLYKMWIAKVNCCLKGGCCVIIYISLLIQVYE